MFDHYYYPESDFKIRQNRILFHHDKYIRPSDWQKFDTEMNVGYNYTVFVSKTSQTYLGFPYGNCSDYSVPSALTYNALSHLQCYRKCVQFKHRIKFNCIPIFIDDTIIELDFESGNNFTNVCDFSTFYERKNLSKHFHDFCLNQCPKECFTVEYNSKVRKSETFIGNAHWFDRPIRDPPTEQYVKFKPQTNFYERPVERRIIWDESEPMFAYIDEPVITFTDYLVFCGGLMGLWFGKSLKDILEHTIELSRKLIQKLHFPSNIG